VGGPFSAVEVHAEMAARPEEVWDVISDPTTYPRWLVGAQRIRGVDRAFPDPGSKFQHSVGPTDGLTVDDSTTATEAIPPYLLELEVSAGLFTADVGIHVAPGAAGSEVCFSEQPLGAFAVLTPLLRPILHSRNAESLRRLDQLLTERAERR
jgi:hypothetical protein